MEGNHARPLARASDVQRRSAATGLQTGEPVRCFLSFSATTEIGPSSVTSYEGIITLVIEDDGAVDDGNLQIQGGERYPLVGSVSGQALWLRVDLGVAGVLTLIGAAQDEIEVCAGNVYGSFGGPQPRDIGTWSAMGLGAA